MATRFTLLLALVLSTSGCFLWTSSGEGDLLRTDVDSQSARIQKLEEAQNAQLDLRGLLATGEVGARPGVDACAIVGMDRLVEPGAIRRRPALRQISSVMRNSPAVERNCRCSRGSLSS